MGAPIEGDLVYYTKYSETGMNVKLTAPIKDHKKSAQMKKRLYVSYLTLYRDYVQKCKEREIKHLNKKDYKKFLNEYFKRVANDVHYQNLIYIMPYGLGRFYLNKSRRYGLIKKKGGAIVHRYFNTFQNYFNMKWDKGGGYFKNRTMWRWSNSAFTKSLTKTIGYSKPSPITNEHGIRKGPIGHNFRGSDKWN